MKPIHPMLVHFPIALLTLSVGADIAGFFGNVDSLRSTGWWSLLGAAIGGIVTVLAGLVDMRRAGLKQEIHQRVHRHMKVGFALLGVILGLALWRSTSFREGLPVTAVYLDCAILALALAGFQGWLGGELVYTHGVSVKRVVSRSGESGKAAKHSDSLVGEDA